MPLENLSRPFVNVGSGPHAPVLYARMSPPPNAYPALGREPTTMETIEIDQAAMRAALRAINTGIAQTPRNTARQLALSANPNKTVSIYYFTRRQQRHIRTDAAATAARVASGHRAKPHAEASAAGGRIHTHHHSTEIEVTPACAIGVLAGVYDFPELFAWCMARVTNHDIKVLNDDLGDKKPAYSMQCARALVQYSARATVLDPGPAGEFVRNAHNLMAHYIATHKNTSEPFNAQEFFATLVRLTAPVNANPQDAAQASAYAGALAGLCLVGIMRYGKAHDKKAEQHRKTFVAFIGLAAAAIGGAVFPGVGAITGVMTTAAQPLADYIFNKLELDETLISVGGDLEAVMRRGVAPREDFDPRVYTEVFQETIHRCGFAF